MRRWDPPVRIDRRVSPLRRSLAGRAQQTPSEQAPPAVAAPARTLVARLDLEKYKATIKALTQFGDRRQGTDRNRPAVDWIEAQLKSYGCPTERACTTSTSRRPNVNPRRPRPPASTWRSRSAAAAARHRDADRREHRSDEAAGREAARAQHAADDAGSARRGRTAPRSARPTRTRCTSSAATWTATAGAKRRTTTDRARRW